MKCKNCKKEFKEERYGQRYCSICRNKIQAIIRMKKEIQRLEDELKK